MELNLQQVWRATCHGLQIKIANWQIRGMEHPTWNYYIYLPESLLKERFAEVWFPPKLVKITPESRGFVSYDYYPSALNVDAWHGGITFYAKHGEVEGFRAIEVGCDYNHFWDEENGHPEDLDGVSYDCEETVKQLLAAFGLPVPPSPSPRGIA